MLIVRLYASHFAGFQGTSADINTFWFTVNEDANFLYIDTPGTAVTVVSVRYVVTAARRFTCYIAFARHRFHLLF